MHTIKSQIIFSNTYISPIAYGLNISKQKSTKMTPFYLMYLRDPHGIEMLNVQNDSEGDNLSEVIFQADTESVVDEVIQKCVEVEKLVRENIDKAQNKQCREHQKKIAKGAKVFAFKVGESVMKLNARKQGQKGDPLAKEWQGPYTLMAIEGKGQCTLKAENGHDLKTKVNISQLKPFKSYQTSSQPHTINKASPDTLNAIDLIGFSAANCSPSCMNNESTDPPSAVTATSSTCVSLGSQRVDGDGHNNFG